MEKRTLIALAAAAFLILGYPAVLKFFYPNYTMEAPAPATAPKSTTPGSAAKAATAATAGKIEKPLTGEDVPVKAGLLELTFNTSGGGIRALSIPGIINSEKRRPIELFSVRGASESSLSAALIENGRVEHGLSSRVSADAGAVRSQMSSGSVTLERTLSMDGYTGKLFVTAANNGTEPRTMSYELVVGSTFAARHSIDGQYHESNFYETKDGKKKLRHINESKAGKTVLSDGAVEWAAVKDRHFSFIVKPEPGRAFTGLVEGLGEHRHRTSLVSDAFTLAPGASRTDTFIVFAGPTQLQYLEPLGLGPIVNFGKMDGIGKLLVGALELIHKMVRNYGLAVIVLTALINLVLFPLTRQSFLSMKRMQVVQPHVKKLQQQHKNNPEKLNRETMELYKKHKVNPFGGCLPMILQMPVFIALYVALSKYVELVNAKFLWIQDLSSPDRFPVGVSLPVLGDHIHLLPLLMVGAMFLQQKFTMMKIEDQDPAMQAQQKMMGVMMPVLFGFIFYSMPSSLVLYWLTNTVIMTAYQFYLRKQSA